MPQMTVTGVTVSLKVNDTDYGRGSERFVSLRGEVPEREIGLDVQNFDGILEQILVLNQQAWEGIQSSRYTGGILKAPELKSLIEQSRTRTSRVLNYLKIERGIDATNSEPTES